MLRGPIKNPVGDADPFFWMVHVGYLDPDQLPETPVERTLIASIATAIDDPILIDDQNSKRVLFSHRSVLPVEPPTCTVGSTIGCPSVHQLPALIKGVATAIGALDGATRLVR